LPLADEVTGADAEERALGLGGDSLGQITLSGARWPVQQDTLPWCTLAGKEMGKFDRQNDGLFQRGLGPFEARNIVPLDVGLLGYDRLRKSTP
jgi:hypothetical protein